MQQGPLPGFRDFYPSEFAERAFIMSKWREVARRFAFMEYDGPPLEPLDLYTKKSGEEIVGQLYNFTDKGGRDVSLRPEMTPTVARMVAARANGLRKPVRWFSIPQLFRYERQQRGRLREHYQLNVDIFGEADVAADAELLAMAIGIMQSFGLKHEHVTAHISDRQLARNLLVHVSSVKQEQLPAVFAVVDKFGREPDAVSRAKLARALDCDDNDGRVESVYAVFQSKNGLEELRAKAKLSLELQQDYERVSRYFDYLDALGVSDWVTLDLSIVRGLAYYTGIVFELFDHDRKFRAICGGGRYDNLLGGLSGVDMPALGFGMGDVVLGELLREHKILSAQVASPEFFLVSQEDGWDPKFMDVATRLRSAGVSVEYPLRPQSHGKQLKAAVAAQATWVAILHSDFVQTKRVHVRRLTHGGTEVVNTRWATAELPDRADVSLDQLDAAIRDFFAKSLTVVSPL